MVSVGWLGCYSIIGWIGLGVDYSMGYDVLMRTLFWPFLSTGAGSGTGEEMWEGLKHGELGNQNGGRCLMSDPGVWAVYLRGIEGHELHVECILCLKLQSHGSLPEMPAVLDGGEGRLDAQVCGGSTVLLVIWSW